MNPTIAPILRYLHAKRPIRGLPGGALRFLRLAAVNHRLGECCFGVFLPVRACSTVGSRLGVDAGVGRHAFVVGLGRGGRHGLAPVTTRNPEMGRNHGASRGWRRRVALERLVRPRALEAERCGVGDGSSKQGPAAFSICQHWPAMDMGGAKQPSGALERPSTRTGVESRLSAYRHLARAGIAGLGSRLAFRSTPWVIFPRA